MAIIDRIPRDSHGEDTVWLGSLRVSTLLFIDNVVHLTSLDLDLQCALSRFAVEYEGLLQVWSHPMGKGGIWTSSNDSKSCSWVMITWRGGWINNQASTVMMTMLQSVVVKKINNPKAKLLIYWSIYVPAFTSAYEVWIVTERTRSWIQAAKADFFSTVDRHSVRGKARCFMILGDLGVESPLLCFKRIQLRWLRRLFKMPFCGHFLGTSHWKSTPRQTQKSEILIDFAIAYSSYKYSCSSQFRSLVILRWRV